MNFNRNRFEQVTQDHHAQEYPPLQPIYVTSGGGAIVVIGNLLLSGIIIYATSQNEQAAPVGIIGAVVSFGTITPLSLMALNGGLVQMVRYWQEQKTARFGMRQQAALSQWEMQQRWQVAEYPRIPYSPPVVPELPSPPRFVPAIPEVDVRVKMHCVNFVTGLFDDDGRPNPKMILPDTAKRPGQVQAKKPGPAPLEYLVALGIVTVDEAGMLFFNTTRYPTLHDAILAIKRGDPAGSVGIPANAPTPHPLIESGATYE